PEGPDVHVAVGLSSRASICRCVWAAAAVPPAAWAGVPPAGWAARAAVLPVGWVGVPPAGWAARAAVLPAGWAAAAPAGWAAWALRRRACSSTAQLAHSLANAGWKA